MSARDAALRPPRPGSEPRPPDASPSESPAPEATRQLELIRFAREQVGQLRAAAVPSQHPSLPTRIGRYRILGEIGRGGMGIVYRATLDHPRRDVALKVLRGAAPTPRRLARFHAEAECLAELDDPRIVGILDAGSALIDGEVRPYLVMELVADGMAITACVRERRLPRRARIELIAEVAEAVGHAHRRGLIHRDLKPANILVDRAGRPHVVDFGVARHVTEPAAVTCDGELVGTLEWMSPEQLRDGRAVDTRSDVFALGMLAFAVLTDRTPSDVEETRDPSGDAHARRFPSLRTIDRTIPTDLDLVIATALEPDRTDRYGTASELAADLRAVLDDRPIAARRQTLVGITVRVIRRNRLRSLAAVAVLIVASSTAWVLVDSARARRLDRQHADASATFLAAMLDRLRPAEMASVDPAVIQPLLDDLEQRVLAQSSAPPRAVVDALRSLGLARMRFGRPDAALGAFERALDEARRADGLTPSLEAHLTLLIIDALMNGGRFDEARTWTESALRTLRTTPTSDPDRSLQFLARRARIDLATGRLDAAAEGLAAVERSLAARGNPSNSLRVEVLGDLGVVERLRGSDLRSVAWLSEALELRRSADPAGEDLETHRTARSLAHAWARLGRLEQARTLLLDTLAPLITLDGIDGKLTARTAWLLLLVEAATNPAEPRLRDDPDEPASDLDIPALAETPDVDLAALHAVALRAGRVELAEVLRAHAGRGAAPDRRAMEIRMLLAEERHEEARWRAEELLDAWMDATARVRQLIRDAPK